MKYEKMNPEYKQKWLDALRSGEYKQTTGALHRADGGFCCLGVLLDLDGEKWAMDYGSGAEFMRPTSQRDISCIENEKYGLGDGGGEIEFDPQYDLARMNDAGRSFAEIADWIEENL